MLLCLTIRSIADFWRKGLHTNTFGQEPILSHNHSAGDIGHA